MWDIVNDAYSETMTLIVKMERHHWFILFGVLVLFGTFCMRGFGSRANY